jgi:hypothetical protein
MGFSLQCVWVGYPNIACVMGAESRSLVAALMMDTVHCIVTPAVIFYGAPEVRRKMLHFKQR